MKLLFQPGEGAVPTGKAIYGAGSWVAFGLLLCCSALAGLSQEANPDTQVQAEFGKRVSEYAKLHKMAREGMDKLKPAKTPEIENHERELAARIRQMRRGARRGDIFTPEISGEFRKLIGITMQGSDAARIRQSLRRAEPVQLKALRVNGTYPKGMPLQSTPATLLLNLPKLPPELEYRVVGRAVVLRDVEANLVVDFMPDAIPAGSDAA